MAARKIGFLVAAVAGALFGNFPGPNRLYAEVASEPAGFHKLTFLGNSDTIVSIPFSRPPLAAASVNSIPAANVVEVRGAPGWASNQLAYAAGVQSNTCYVRFFSGNKEGVIYPVLANGTNTLTLNVGSDSLSTVTNGTRLQVIPFWTLGSVFPNGRGVVASTSQAIRRTEVLIPDFSASGINLSSTATYYFLLPTGSTTGTWRKVGAGTSNKNDDIFLPDAYFIVRHNTSTGTVLTGLGTVPASKYVIPLLTLSTAKADNSVALSRPVPVSLDDSGLFQSGAFRASASQANRTDELLVFDNSQTGQNKSSVATYYYLNTWRRVGSGTANMGSQQIFTPGTGVIIRKGATANGLSSSWTNSPTY